MPGDSLSFANDQERQRLVTSLRESEILRELAELLASSLDLDSILQVLVKRTTDVCDVERCAVWLLEDARGVFQPVTYHLSSQHLNNKVISAGDSIWHRTPLPFDDPLIHHLLKGKGMLAVEDLHAEPSMRVIAETFLVRSVLLVALIREGRPVGMMSLDNPDKITTFSAEQQQLARSIGQQAAVAIDNARLYQQAQVERRRAELLIDRARSIYQVALAVNSGEDLAAVLGIATHHMVRGLDADGGAIFLLEADTLRLASTTQQQEQTPVLHTTAALADLPNCQHAATTGLPLFVTAEQAEDVEILWYRKLGLQNTMIVPLIVGTERNDNWPASGKAKWNLPHADRTPETSHCVGLAFVNYARTNYHPSKGQFAFAQDIAAQCALAIEKAHLLSDARQAAALATAHANTLDAVFQTMTEGISVYNMNGQVLLSNNAASSFLGANFSKERLDEFLESQPAYSIHGQPLSSVDFPINRALRGEHIRGERLVVKRADDVERVLEMNVAPMFDSTLQQIGVVSAFRDITEHVRVEQRLRKALETMLRVAEAVSGITDIKDILHSVLTMTLMTLNCDRGLIQLYDEERQTFTQLLSIGFSQEAESQWLTEQSVWLTPELNQYHGFRTQLMEGHAALVNAEQYPFQPNPFTHTMVLAAPIMHNNRLSALIVLDRSHHQKNDAQPAPSEQKASAAPPIAFFTDKEFTIWDIAVIEGIAKLAGLAMEQARWQEEADTARTSEAALREANALKDEFLAITAHEFRTPLTVILAHSQVALRAQRRLSDQDQLNPLTENLLTIEEQTRLLTNIVNTFLEVTQINRGQLSLIVGEVDLTDIVKQVVADHSATSIHHQILCSIEPSEQPYLVEGDSARLLQIIANLVQNAIKYSPLGGPVTVSLRQKTDNKRSTVIEVCVADKGIGVPKDAQARLFERFYRAANSAESSTRGIGLGLYVVAQLLQLHGSTIHVESSGVYGEGSRFIFTLPLLEKT